MTSIEVLLKLILQLLAFVRLKELFYIRMAFSDTIYSVNNKEKETFLQMKDLGFHA